MLAIKMDAQYQDDDGAYEKEKIYDILAVSLSNDIEEAINSIANLIGGNGWDELNIERYSEIDNSDHVPKSISSKLNWKKDLQEFGVIYIVYK